MQNLRLMPVWMLFVLLAGCVTINVYFPAAAAEKAADRIIKDVYGTQPESEQPAPESAPSPQSLNGPGAHWLMAVLEVAIPPAHAAADISVQSPAINNLRARMKNRHQQLQPYYNQGAVGIAHDGELQIRDLNAVSLRERAQLKQLVEAENRDRNALYKEIAKANGHPEWEDEIRATFSRRWIDNAPSGWWYQDAGGNWKQK